MNERYATWSTRGAFSLLSIVVTLVAVPRMGVRDGGDLLVATAFAQLGGVLASSVSGTHAFRLGVAGVALRSTSTLRLLARSLAALGVIVVVAVVIAAIFGSGGLSSSLLVNVALGSVGLSVARLWAEHQKGVGRPTTSILLETAPAILAPLVVLFFGPPALPYLGLVMLIVALVLAGGVAVSPFFPIAPVGHAPAGEHRWDDDSLRDGLLLAIVPLAILLSTYGPLLWLRASGAPDSVVASYAILQRSFAPVTIGLGIVNVLHLRGVVSPYVGRDFVTFAAAARRSTRSARLISTPLLAASVALGALALYLGELLTSTAFVAMVVLTLAQASNASVGIPTEINLAIGRKKAEIAGAVVALAAMLVLLVASAQQSTVAILLAAVGATLVAQLIRNIVSYLNLRSVVIDLRAAGDGQSSDWPAKHGAAPGGHQTNPLGAEKLEAPHAP